MSIMGSIYTNPSELGSDYWKERAETYLHDQELYQKDCDALRKQLHEELLKKAKAYSELGKVAIERDALQSKLDIAVDRLKMMRLDVMVEPSEFIQACIDTTLAEINGGVNE
jgi:hypothetical protein